MSNHNQARTESQDQSRGLMVFVALAVLTIVEYVVAVGLESPAMLVILLTLAAIGKCWAIVTYFMHIGKLWHGEEAH